MQIVGMVRDLLGELCQCTPSSTV